MNKADKGQSKNRQPDIENNGLRQFLNFSPRSGWLILTLIVLAVTIRTFDGIDSTHLKIEIIVRFLVLLVLLFYFMGKILDWNWRFPNAGILAPTLLFALGILISLSQADNYYIAREKTFEWLGLMALCFIIIDSVSDRASFKLILFALLATGFASAVYGLYDGYIIKPAWALDALNTPETILDAFGNTVTAQLAATRLGSQDVSGPFAISNSFAGFLAIIIILQTGVTWAAVRMAFAPASSEKEGGTFWQRAATGKALPHAVLAVFSAIVLGVEIWAILLTKSRGGILGLIAGIVLFAIFASKLWHWLSADRKRLAVFFAIIIIIPVFLFASGIAFNSSSMQVRAEYWKGAAGIIKDFWPAGIGLENFPNFYETYKSEAGTWARRAHNNYLQIFAETGFIGFAGFLWFWFAFYRHNSPRKNLTQAETCKPAPSVSNGYDMILIGAFAALFGFAGVFFLEPMLSRSIENAPISGPIIFILISLCWLAYFFAGICGLREQAAQEESREIPQDDAWSVIHYALLAAVASFLVHSLADFTLYVPAVWASVIICVALACAYRANIATPLPEKEKAQKQASGKSIGSRQIALSAAALIIGATLWWNYITKPWECNTEIDFADYNSDVAKRAINAMQRQGVSFAELSSGDRKIIILSLSAAETHLSNALMLDDSDPNTFEQLGFVLNTFYYLDPEKYRDKFERAKEMYRQATLHNPHNSALHAAYGAVLSQEDKEESLEAALAEFRKTIDIYPLNPPAFFSQAKIEFRLGRMDKAYAAANEALDINRRVAKVKLTDETKLLDPAELVSAFGFTLEAAKKMDDNNALRKTLKYIEEYFSDGDRQDTSFCKSPSIALMAGDTLSLLGEKELAEKYYEKAVLLHKKILSLDKSGGSTTMQRIHRLLSPDDLRRAEQYAAEGGD